MNRRRFFATATTAALARAQDPRTRLGLVRSTHSALRSPAPLDNPLSYEQVRDMVFRAIELGAPRAGSLEAKIRSGAWVVVKPNIVALRPRLGYRTGDITDFRVTQAVVEYLATRSPASRITVAEGGSYRRETDPAEDSATLQGGRRVSALTFDWGPDEFPGFDGSLGDMLQRFAARHPDKKFDYIDLSYDCIRDPGGAFRRLPVPAAPNGVGAFSDRPDYFVTNTITRCDFLVTVPVMKVHTMCGITSCLKNYVGTAPREAYGQPGVFSNVKLHSEHSAGGRIDPFITDLAAFHPPDFCVVDGIRGLQNQEHSNHRPDQMVRSNLVLAGEDPVAADAIVARLLGFNPYDIEFLHMAQRRLMGTMDLARIDVRGDEPDRHSRRWEKPPQWYGRSNRLWLLESRPGEWRPHEARFDTLDLPAATGRPPAAGTTYRAAATIDSPSYLRGFLWLGLRGKLHATLNGHTVAKFDSQTRYRVGQFQFPISLAPGRNRLELTVEPLAGQALVSALVTGPRNDGDTPDALRWLVT